MGYATCMKTTVEIADPILKRAKTLARRRHTTLRSLMEEGLVFILNDSSRTNSTPIDPVTFKGEGLSDVFISKGWNAIRDAAYEGHGA